MGHRLMTHQNHDQTQFSKKKTDTHPPICTQFKQETRQQKKNNPLCRATPNELKPMTKHTPFIQPHQQSMLRLNLSTIWIRILNI